MIDFLILIGLIILYFVCSEVYRLYCEKKAFKRIKRKILKEWEENHKEDADEMKE